ncbi:hypothetical protein IEZ26_06655 [Nocardioides cavernae]|uniref:SGNH hydrolase-type esterase domain-containing protein n=1 Tax=Nocardioides cavernae TaxID=1921566 RepID=A0ABR8N815_9ACTN|nr:GDSL-type esterase/lipase family protein [Nocardioides cavernae]MBD3924296.1 hypothetical protein [Nocardioides cavernae]MBM7510762.1 lysophospholipase L1-like esterase [Nocardioides cavernae]
MFESIPVPATQKQPEPFQASVSDVGADDREFGAPPVATPTVEASAAGDEHSPEAEAAEASERAGRSDEPPPGQPPTTTPAPAPVEPARARRDDPARVTTGGSAGQTIAFVIALTVLFVVAQAESPRVVVLAMFVVYVAVATLWIRGQYAESLAGRFTAPTLQFLKVSLLVAAGFAVGGFGYSKIDDRVPETWPLRPSSFYLVAVLILYFVLGYAIARNRTLVGTQRASGSRVVRVLRMVRSSFALLSVCLLLLGAAFAGGLLLLGHDFGWWPLVPLLAAVFGFPWVASLMSEHVIQFFSANPRTVVDPEPEKADTEADKPDRWKRSWARLRRDRSHLRIIAILVGVVVAIASLVGVYAVAGNFIAVLGIAALMLLVVALTSFTLADIAVVLALVALMGVTPRQDKDLPAPTQNDPSVLVALGDSYMSGEGASTFIAGTDEGDENECRRARTAWAAMVGSQPPFDSVVFLACSGADTYNLRHEGSDAQPVPEPSSGEELTQLDAYDDVASTFPEPALVVVSIGGNDAGFASIGLTCLAPGDCNDPTPKKLWSTGNLDRLENRLRQAYEELYREFKDVPVAVILYPSPIDAANAPCPEADLSPGDVTFVNGFLSKLNNRIRNIAPEYGFYVTEDMVNALTDGDLRLCDPDNNGYPGLNFIGLRSVGGLAGQRFNPGQWHHNSLHPNERGHAALQAAFLRWLEARGGVEELEPARQRVFPARKIIESVSEEHLESRDPDKCWTFDPDGANGCKKQSQNWAARSTASAVLLWGVPVTLALLAVWFGSCAFFGWRRNATTRT